MKPLRGLQPKLQNKLSLSSKIFLRRLYAGFTRPFLRISEKLEGLRPAAEVPTPPAWKTRDPTALLDELLRKRYLPRDTEGQIRTSVVIPVFNKVDFTFECLQSLLTAIDLNTTEVIIVNNASTDETSDMLGQFKEFIHVEDNEENQGFVDACNQGAAIARGRYLVFLNNDTTILPDWLENLVDTIESDSSVGAVGSMFLYADGKIQEAGAIVWKTGEAFHYGWGKSPDDRRYNFAREVDYCSAASLLIRKDLFERLGGFDRRYSPAYYEDVDLCFGVRSLGYKVIYQPLSRVIHYEGVTAGRDTAIGIKQYQIINRQKFYEKWREVLERDHFEFNVNLAEEVANRKTGPRIIVFDDRVPMPDRDSGSARMLNILKALTRIGKPVFVPMKPLPEYERLLWKEGIETANVVDYLRLIKKRDFRVAIFSRPEVAAALIPSVRKANGALKVVFDMVDASFIRLRREYEITGSPKRAEEARRLEALELKLARASDQVWCVSLADKEAVSKAVAEERFVIVPNIHGPMDRGRSWGERAGLLFIGHMSHRPNSDAIHYFMREIFPLIQQQLPSIEFRIVGSNASPGIKAYHSSNVKVMGYVPDIDPLLQGARVFVAPLRFGAGVNGKIGESLSYGLPVVTNSIGAEGLGLTQDQDAMIADDPKDFAAGVLQVYRDAELWERLADRGYRHIEKHFTPEIVGKTIEAGLRDLGVLDDH